MTTQERLKRFRFVCALVSDALADHSINHIRNDATALLERLERIIHGGPRTWYADMANMEIWHEPGPGRIALQEVPVKGETQDKYSKPGEHEMSDFEIDLKGEITEDGLRNTIAGYCSAYSVQFALTSADGQLTLAKADETICTGTLREVAYYWEGFVAGQIQGLPEQDLEDGV